MSKRSCSTTQSYASWLSTFDFESFITLRIPPSLPMSEAHRYFRNEVLLPLCRSRERNQIAAVTLLSPGHIGFQQRHLHSAIATKNRDVNQRISEFLATLPDSMHKLVRGKVALSIIPFRHEVTFDAQGNEIPSHPQYMAGHIIGTEDLYVYSQKFLETLKRS